MLGGAAEGYRNYRVFATIVDMYHNNGHVRLLRLLNNEDAVLAGGRFSAQGGVLRCWLHVAQPTLCEDAGNPFDTKVS